MRVFAGPNGSGKSTLKSVLPAKLLGIYLNPDDIEARIQSTGILDFANLGIADAAIGIIPFLASAPILLRGGLTKECDKLKFVENKLQFQDVEVNSYWASPPSTSFENSSLKRAQLSRLKLSCRIPARLIF